ncbi:unnamed protein product, partial [marine sediment metagenome]
KKREGAKFPFPIAYKKVLKAMLTRLGYDLRCLHLASFGKDFFSYALDITLDLVKGK